MKTTKKKKDFKDLKKEPPQEFTMKKAEYDQFIREESNTEVRCLGPNGKLVKPESQDLLIKVYINKLNRKERYFIRTYNQEGIRDSKLFNPFLDKFTNPVKRSIKTWEYKEYTAKCFDLYFKFITSGQQAFLRQAERELE